MPKKPDARTLISKTRLALLMNRDSPMAFVANVAMQLDIKVVPKDTLARKSGLDPDKVVTPLVTDGLTIFVADNVGDVLTDRYERMFGVAHEVVHVLTRDHARLLGKDPQLRALALDIKTNGMLAKWGFKVPPWAVRCVELEHLLAEEIYRRLERKSCAKGQGGTRKGTGLPGGRKGQAGSCCGTAPQDGHDHDADRVRTEQILLRAAASAGRGSVPAEFSHLLDRFAHSPPVPWEVLREWLTSRFSTGDWSLRKPNRKVLAATGLYTPGLVPEPDGHVVFFVDTSGSCFNILSTFAAHVNDAVHEIKPAAVTVVCTDAAVHCVHQYGPDDTIDFTPHGGGGTDFAPAFEYVRDHGLDPDCAVFLTDLDGTFPDFVPPYPVLWVQHGHYRANAPFGTVLRVS